MWGADRERCLNYFFTLNYLLFLHLEGLNQCRLLRTLDNVMRAATTGKKIRPLRFPAVRIFLLLAHLVSLLDLCSPSTFSRGSRFRFLWGGYFATLALSQQYNFASVSAIHNYARKASPEVGKPVDVLRLEPTSSERACNVVSFCSATCLTKYHSHSFESKPYAFLPIIVYVGCAFTRIFLMCSTRRSGRL